MRFKTVLLVLLLVLVAVFAIQNMAAVSVRFLAWELTIPRALMVFALLGIGIITGWLAATLGKRK